MDRCQHSSHGKAAGEAFGGDDAIRLESLAAEDVVPFRVEHGMLA